MTLRVLEIIPTLDRGGAEKQMALLATGLPRDSYDVHVAALTRGGPLADTLAARDIPVHRIDKRWKADPAAFWRLRRLIKELRPDIVHTWIFAANCYGRQAAFSAQVPHVIAGERCVDRWKVAYEFAIDRHLAKRTSRIATNSAGIREFYVEHGIPDDKFVVIPNGIPISPAGHLPNSLTKAADSEPAGSLVSREDWLDHLNLPHSARLIGAVGRLWPQKRYKDLIWAAELLKVIRDDTHLLIVGDGPQRWRLERFRDQVGIRDRVHFLGHREDVFNLLPHLDCFWLGSAYEGQSNALMEAMLAGLPVVATDITGNRELVTDGETGLLIPIGDRAGLARQTRQLLDNASEARRLGEAARRRMRTEFTVERMVKRYDDLYREVAAD